MISQEQMQEIYEQVKTDVKHGPVMKMEGVLCDSPVVFKEQNSWYMSFIGIDSECNTGYKTYIAKGKDLYHFEIISEILTKKCDWDKSQCGGYAQLIENTFGATNEIQKINNQYLFAFIGGNFTGYETDPLSLGIATANVLTDDSTYQKSKAPILSGKDFDARVGETLTIYKPCIFEDDLLTLGHKYVCFYNAKGENHRESIFVAVSDDGYNYQRYGDKAVLDIRDCPSEQTINGDPQIVRINDLYVMFYFIHNPKGRTYNTFAASKDLVHWTKWEGTPLMESEFEWEDLYAHKQWIMKERDIVYHYYCAVNKRGERFIALATSK